MKPGSHKPKIYTELVATALEATKMVKNPELRYIAFTAILDDLLRLQRKQKLLLERQKPAIRTDQLRPYKPYIA
jgi:hypothetical protein